MLNFLLGKTIRFAKRAPKWANIRKTHLEKYPKCAACGTTKNLEVHHIIPVHLDPGKELDYDNLITLCSNQCHILFGHLMNFKSWNKDVIKDSEVYYNKIRDRP